MIPGMNPKMMKQAMKRMGIKQDDLDAKQVIVIMPDKKLVFDNPTLSKINMGGQETFQLNGEYTEEALSTEAEINEEDVKTVMEKTGVGEEKAREAIKEANGDLAEAIMKLTESKE